MNEKEFYAIITEHVKWDIKAWCWQCDPLMTLKLSPDHWLNFWKKVILPNI